MKKTGLLTVLLFVVLTACAGRTAVPAIEPLVELTKAPVIPGEKTPVKPNFIIIPESPRPGEPVTIAVNTSAREALLMVNNRQTAKTVFFPVTFKNRRLNFMAAILTIPCSVQTGQSSNPARVFFIVNDKNGVTFEIPVTIAHREFRSETLQLTATLTNLLTARREEREAESNRLWSILSTTGDQVYHFDSFVLPVTSTRRTSQFGSRRINQHADGRRVTSIHAGVDFGIPTGTEVYASGRGLVVLSRARIVSGNSIIIEHAPGIYSIYYHLDSVIAEEGAIVEAGEVIGLSGSTGFSTGPHLHWEVRVSTENTDPDAFVERPLIDKDLIISRLFN
ncbi:MAG: M23 family metallopeptidase [Treponema sp.]|jgi:hypothetical protein|nr:M23 family metallopeptidase [Treponema sp.]